MAVARNRMSFEIMISRRRCSHCSCDIADSKNTKNRDKREIVAAAG